MPSALEQFNRQILQTNLSLPELINLLKTSQKMFAELDAKIRTSETKLGEMSSKLARLRAEVASAETPGWRRTQVEAQISALEQRIQSRTFTKGNLEAERRGIKELAPTQDIVNAKKALQTLTEAYATNGQAKIDAMRAGNTAEAARLTEEMRKQEKSIIRVTSALTYYTNAINDFKVASRNAATGAGAGIGQGPFPEAGANAAATRGAQLRQSSFFNASPRRQQQAVAAAVDAAYREWEQRVNAREPGSAERRRDFAAYSASLQRTSMTASYYGDPKYQSARGIATERGFGPEAIRTVTESGLAGIQKLSYAEKGLDGITRKLDLFVDKTGRVLPSASRQFSTFASSVARDLRELTKWTIAIQLIYGPMRKLQEIMGLMIENEVRLADASIAVSDSTLKMGDIFDIASEAANAMGENVSDVIVNFSEAYQATGGLSDSTQRVAQATQLMNDALILSKLSSLSATESIDTLASALRQTGSSLDSANKDLDNNGSLLDKWVKVTKVANVSLDTLATGFSVLGEAANTAGLSTEELNAVLAVTSETMGVSGREAANMARSFVAGFQSDKAIRALEAIGISTTDVNGEMRTLLELQKDLYYANLSGAVSQAAFSKATLAIGGGTRRQAAVAGFIESAPRVEEIINAQVGAKGEALAALEKQLGTVQTAMTRLQNAFQSLAQSLGDEGGLLDVFRVVLDLLTKIVTMADKAFETMGKSGPVLALALAAGQIIKSQGPLWGSNFAASAGLAVTGLTGGPGPGGKGINKWGTFAQNVFMPYNQVGRQQYSSGILPPMPQQNQAPAAFSNIMAAKTTGVVGAALMMSALPAIQNYSNFNQGTDRFGGAKATADVLGGALGAAAGAALIGNPLIGAAIGTAIAESFVTSATSELSMTNVFKNVSLTDFGAVSPYGTNANDLLGGNSIKQWGAQYVSKTLGTMFDFLNIGIGMLPEETRKSLGINQKIGAMSTENLLYALLPEADKKAFDQEYAKLLASGKIVAEPQKRPFEEAEKYQQVQNRTYIDTIQKQREQELLTKLIQGKMTPTAYSGKMQDLGTFNERATRYYAAFGDQFLKISDDINTAEQAYSAFLDIFTYGNEEQLGNLTAMVTEIADLTNKIQALKEAGTGTQQIKEMEAEIVRLQGILAQTTNQMYQQTKWEQFPVPGIINQNKPITGTSSMLKQLIEGARAEEMKYYTSPGLGAAQKTPEDVENLRQSMEDFTIVIMEGGEEVYYTFSELAKKLTGSSELVGSDWFQKILDEMVLTGKIEVEVTTQEATWGGILDIPKSMEGILNQWIAYAQSMMEGYGLAVNKEETMIVEFSDGQWGKVHGDNRAVQYALSKIQETEQKQLEQGIWNIPEGASFWVPITSLTPANQPQGSSWNAVGPPPSEFPEAQGTTPTTGEGITAPGGRWNSEAWNTRIENNNKLIEEALGTILAGETTPMPISGEELKSRRERMSRGWTTATVPEGYTTKPVTTTEPGFWEQIKMFFNNLLNLDIQPKDRPRKSGALGIESPLGTAFARPGEPSLAGTLQSLTEMLRLSQMGAGAIGRQAAENVQTMPKIGLNLTNTTTITLDGRVLATAIKPYLLADITRAAGALGRQTSGPI